MLATFAMCATVPVRAQVSVSIACTEPRVVFEGTEDAHWLETLATLCERLAALHDRDTSADIRIVPVEAAIIVEVTLVDGRRALRRVDDATRLMATIEPLVTLPPSEANAPTAQVHAPASDEPTRADRAAAAAVSEPVRESTQRDTVPNIELGAATGARVARKPNYLFVGGGAYAALHFDRWVFGLTVRWDAVELLKQPHAPDFEYTAFGAGLLLATRLLSTSSPLLDVGGSVLVVGETQSLRPNQREDTNSTADVRFGASTRLHLGRGAIKLLVSLDVEVSPTRLRRPTQLASDLPTLPAWGLGLMLGASYHGS